MRSYNQLKNKATQLTLVLVTLSSLLISACVKPKNHESGVDASASFYVTEVKASVDNAENVDGFSIPKARLYTFTACLKDRRTDESLPGAPFVVSGGERDLDAPTDKDGCAIWREKIAFDYLAAEVYLPLERTITAKGSGVGSRKVKLAINPWGLTEGADKFKDLEHASVESSQLATPDVAAKVLKADLVGSSKRQLYFANLPIKNSARASSNGSVRRDLQVTLDSSVMLTALNNVQKSVSVLAAQGRLKVTATIIESVTSGGQEKQTVVSRTAETRNELQDGRSIANLSFKVGQGTSASRFFLAVRIAPVDGPKGLNAFEGLFLLGDLKALTETGSSTAELKISNIDQKFSYDDVMLKSEKAVTVQDDASPSELLAKPTPSKAGAKPGKSQAQPSLVGADGRAPSVPQNSGAGRFVKTFSISRIEPTYSAVAGGVDVTNQRTVMLRLKACVNDVSNGGRAAAGVEFQIQLSDKSWIKRTTQTLNGLEGCLEWEDKITHRYYEPERFFVIPVTFKHTSGFHETRTYAIDPWQSFRFSADAAMQPEMIQTVNTREKKPTRMLIRNIEINTAAGPTYQVDDFLSLTTIRTLTLSAAVSMLRPSNVIEGINTPSEQLRQGRYLLKAAYVTPLRNVAKKSVDLSVSPMIGLTQVVNVEGGQLTAMIRFPIADLRVINSRSFLVFEVYLLDEARLPKNDPYLRGANLDPMKFVDTQSNISAPTFVGALNMKQEKDSAILLKAENMGMVLPLSDRINSITNLAALATPAPISPFANITVDRLYSMAKRDREAYRAQMSVQRSLALLAIRANADVVFLKDEAKNAGADPLFKKTNTVIGPASRSLKALLNNLNAPLEKYGSGAAPAALGFKPANITVGVLKSFVRGQQGSFSKALATQFCGYFFASVVRSKVSGLSLAFVEGGNTGAWMDACIADVMARGPDAVFSVDHRIRVLKTSGTKWAPAVETGLKTGANVGFGQMKSSAWGWGSGFGSGGLGGYLTSLAASGAGNRVAKFFMSSLIGGLGVEVTRSDSTSAFLQGGFAFEAGVGLSVEKVEGRIAVSAWDECAIVRPRPKMFESYRSSLYMGLLKKTIGASQADELMGRGLMICNGEVSREVRELSERYYAVGYQMSGGNVTDLRDASNLPWLMSLRGQRDYATFVMMAAGQGQTMAQAKDDAIDLTTLPLSRLEKAYSDHFSGQISAIPGYITNEPKIVYRKLN